MRNGRCRLHGGKSTGPRTEEGRARIRAARTRHGLYSAEGRAFQRNITGLLSRSRQLLRLASQPGPVDAAALSHLLPPHFGKHPMQREIAPGLQSGGGATCKPRSLPLTRQNPKQRETSVPPGDPHVAPAQARGHGPSPGQTPELAAQPSRCRDDDRDGAQTAPGENPMQREAAAARAQTVWQNPVQREKPNLPATRPAAPATSSPAPAIRRPILLARPIPPAP
jgi:hypothetical protein